MKLHCVTITGADDEVDAHRLVQLSRDYPFVEWGILFSLSRKGGPRYPSDGWTQDFITACKNAPHEVKRSAHLCGQYAASYLTGTMRMNFKQDFQRIQVNYVFDRPANYALLAKFIELDQPRMVITQHNRKNAHVIYKLGHLQNHQVLYDESGGRGTPGLGDWQEPFGHTLCGYAGGITPDNLEHNLAEIARLAGASTVWIDMESGVRTNDHWDWDKVERVLDTISQYPELIA